MRAPRWLMLVVALGAVALPSGTARASEPTFFAVTEPSWAGPTVGGEWTPDGDEATLSITGGHPYSDGHTTFIGTWTSPLLPRDATPSIDYRFTFDLVNDMGHLEKLQFLVRSRRGGRPWSRWDVTTVPLSPMGHSLEGDASHALVLRSPERVRFQWRVRGRMEGPTGLSGEILVGPGG
jgi:hypothetical protein